MSEEFKINIGPEFNQGNVICMGPALAGEPGREMMRFEKNGDIYVRGVLTTNDLEVVEGFRAFLVACGTIKP
jgi:hypothetical protein